MHMNNMNSKINNKVDLKKVILKTVATAGVLAMAILAPNAIQILRPFIKNKRKYNSKWDGKWRVVIFDVWENTRYKRNLLRNEIKDFGFVQLQRSVWIYPYECADFIELLKTDLSFGNNIRYMVVEKLDHDENLRKRFGIK